MANWAGAGGSLANSARPLSDRLAIERVRTPTGVGGRLRAAAPTPSADDGGAVTVGVGRIVGVSEAR
jgi:hypothetical protein